jgi:hypothetical protein
VRRDHDLGQVRDGRLRSADRWNVRHFARATPELNATFALKLHRLSQRLAIEVRDDYVRGDRETVRPDYEGPVRIGLAFSGSAERSLYSAEPTRRGILRSQRGAADNDGSGVLLVRIYSESLLPSAVFGG